MQKITLGMIAVFWLSAGCPAPEEEKLDTQPLQNKPINSSDSGSVEEIVSNDDGGATFEPPSSRDAGSSSLEPETLDGGAEIVTEDAGTTSVIESLDS